jgi:hypothetical protein
MRKTDETFEAIFGDSLLSHFSNTLNKYFQKKKGKKRKGEWESPPNRQKGNGINPCSTKAEKTTKTGAGYKVEGMN